MLAGRQVLRAVQQECAALAVDAAAQQQQPVLVLLAAPRIFRARYADVQQGTARTSMYNRQIV